MIQPSPMAINVVEVREKPGFKFAVVSGTPADHSSWWSFDDEQIVRDRWWHPAPGETVLDIGAAFGSYALPALAKGARVVCFNPADFDMELLAKNLGLNPDLEARCLLAKVGLYSSDGWFDPDKCQFTPDDQTTQPAAHLFGMIGNREDGGAGFDKSKKIRTTTLDAWMAVHPGVVSVDWMKLDVEGAEVEVLKGAAQTLTRYRPRILVECHQFHDNTIEQRTIDYLATFGYRCEGPVPHGAVSHAFFAVTR